MTGTNCDLFTHSQSQSYLNYLVYLLFNALILLFSFKTHYLIYYFERDLIYFRCRS
jgi:hypothetical protein